MPLKKSENETELNTLFPVKVADCKRKEERDRKKERKKENKRQI